MIQVPKPNKFRKTRSRLGQENPKKEVEPIAPTRKLRHKQNILFRSTNTSKTKLEEEAIIPPPLRRGGGVFIVGFPPTRRPGHKIMISVVVVLITENDFRLGKLCNMYVCMVITYSRVWINRVRLPVLLVVS